jgi:hypothetical protein
VPATEPRKWTGDPLKLRWIVLAVALMSTGVKLLIASRTFGTDDVHYWTEFAEGVSRFGPVGIYGHPFFSVYNHPPLIGWMLAAFNGLVDLGMRLSFLMRVPASVADLGTAVLLFEILRTRATARAAATAAVLFAVSPLMVFVSGFHGNTDPFFVLVSLLAVYLVAVRGQHVGGGIAFGLAVSIKLVPIVLAPMLLVMLLRRGLAPTLRFVAGGLVVFVALWLPVLVLRGPEFADQVLNYSGIGFTQWGVPELVRQMGLGEVARDAFLDHARVPAVLAAALIPAVVVWRRPQAWTVAFGLSFAIFLLLSMAFGMQYLVWPLAAAYLVDWRSATVYNVAASAFAYVVYSHWNGGSWWHWYEAVGAPFTQGQLLLMIVTWVALLLVIAHGLLITRQLPRP